MVSLCETFTFSVFPVPVATLNQKFYDEQTWLSSGFKNSAENWSNPFHKSSKSDILNNLLKLTSHTVHPNKYQSNPAFHMRHLHMLLNLYLLVTQCGSFLDLRNEALLTIPATPQVMSCFPVSSANVGMSSESLHDTLFTEDDRLYICSVRTMCQSGSNWPIRD